MTLVITLIIDRQKLNTIKVNSNEPEIEYLLDTFGRSRRPMIMRGCFYSTQNTNLGPKLQTNT